MKNPCFVIFVYDRILQVLKQWGKMRDRENEIRKFTWKYYALSFFERASFLAPYLTIMFSDYGLNAKKLSFVFVIALLTQMIFEIPSGTLADRFGRKNTLLLGSFSYIVALTVLFFGKNFITFVIACMFYGLAMSLKSGTFMALVYDNMKDLDIVKNFAKLKGRATGFGLVGISLSALGASFLIKFGYNYLIIASFAVNLIYFIINYFIQR